MSETDTIYVKLNVSYGKPTELDDVGCDGLYIESAEICTKEIAQLERLKEYATHKPGCYENSKLCICGLDALLTAEEPKEE